MLYTKGGTITRPRLTVSGGRGGGRSGMAAWAPPPDPPTPHHIKKYVHRKKKIYQRGRHWRSIFGTQTLFWALTPTHTPTHTTLPLW